MTRSHGPARAALLRLAACLMVMGAVVPAAAATCSVGRPAADMVAAARQFMAGTTYRSYSSGHGSQIEHASSGGRVYLWYPGNSVILPGRWMIKPYAEQACLSDYDVAICFQYGANTYNPVTGSRGTAWECQPYSRFRTTRREIVGGDPLGLARMRRPPFVLPREDLPIATIRSRY